MTLHSLPSTTICPPQSPPLRREKWLVCDENNAPVTVLAGRYGQSPYSPYRASEEEAAMLLEIKRTFRGQRVVSRPDIQSEGARCRFEIHRETPIAPDQHAAAPLPMTLPAPSQTELFGETP